MLTEHMIITDMEETGKLLYTTPLVKALSLISEGIICDSEDFDEGHDED